MDPDAKWEVDIKNYALFIYLLFIFVEITLRAIQVTTLHKSWWDTAWFIFSCRLSWFQGLCSCHCLPEHSLVSLKVWLLLYSLPQRELLRVFSCQKLSDDPFSSLSGQTSWSSSKPRFSSTSKFQNIGFNKIQSTLGNKFELFYFQVAKRRKSLLNYMLFLRLTPTLPNTFINFASPIVDVPYHIFFLGTVIGLIPAAYVTVRVCGYQNNYIFVL